MSRSKLFAVTGAFAMAAILASPALAQINEAVAQEVIALAKAEWAAFDDNNVKEASKNWANEYTQFNPTFGIRVIARLDIFLAIQDRQDLSSMPNNFVYLGRHRPHREWQLGQ